MSDRYDDFYAGCRVRHSCMTNPISNRKHTTRRMVVREGTVTGVDDRGIHVAFEGCEGIYDRRWLEIADAKLEIIPS